MTHSGGGIGDGDVLAAGRPMSGKLRAAARQWRDSNRDSNYLLTGKAFLVSQCWLYTTGNYKPDSAGYDPEVSEFIEAGKAALGGEAGWNALLAQKTSCSGCGLAFHLENIGICTGCMAYVCGSCQNSHSACGGEIVG